MRKILEYTKEIKIKACKDYERGNLSFMNIAKTIGTSKSSIHNWYSRYKEYGPNAFRESNNNRYYNEFKLSVIKKNKQWCNSLHLLTYTLGVFFWS